MRSRRTRLIGELVLLTLWAVAAFIAASTLDLFETFASWSRRHEDLNLDEIGVVCVVVMIGLGVFGWRRYGEAQAEARRTEQARALLMETSDRYQSLFTHNPHGIYSFDLEGRFVSVNEAGQVQTGRSEADLLGRNLADLAEPDNLDSSVEVFQSALAGNAEAIRSVLLRPNGERIDVAVNLSPIVVRGKVVGVYALTEDVTSEHRLERELQRTQAAVAAALDGVLIGDEDHRVVYANEASVRLHGYDSAEQMAGQRLEDLLGTADSTAFHSAVMARVHRNGRWTGQLVGSRRDSTTFVAEASFSMLPDGCVVAIARDVTARVEADNALRTSEERYRAVLADIAGGYYETDLSGNIVYLNDASARIVGRDREEVLGTRFDLYAAPDAVATLREHTMKVMHTGITDLGFDWHLVTPDGTRRLVSTSIASVRGDDGEILGFRGLLRDVTDRHETQRALIYSEERYRLLTRVTREVIWDANPGSGRITLSGAVRDLLGFPHETVEVDEAWWRSRIHPDDRPEVIASALAAFQSASHQWFHEYRLRDHTDRYLTVMARGLIIRDETGQAIRFVGSIMDITQRRRHEEELRVAYRAAEDATEAKSLFLANMSHEIRTPLTSVIAGTEMVMESPLNPHQERLMGRVHRAGERLLRLVDDLLDFSKIEAGQIRIDNLPFDPATVVHQTAVWANDACVEKGLEFRLTMPESISQPMLGDAHRLGQVLTNLIGNAVKFTSTGHVHLSVQTVSADAFSTRLTFTVEDSGTGISPEHQAHIFQSFSQADPSITRRFGGSGLGLAIAKDIVEFMGGWIGVESTLGHGSRFFFEVPFAIPASQSESHRTA